MAAAAAEEEEAKHSSALIKVNIADNILAAPKNGRIECRLANIGEVLPGGGILGKDLTNVPDHDLPAHIKAWL
jgi:hypothetical protein